LALFTSSEWRASRGAPIADGGRLKRLATITTALIYLQIVFGAVLRHSSERLDAHLLIAALVALHVILLLLRITRAHSDHAQLVRPTIFLSLLLLLQFMLGAAAYFSKFTAMLQWTLATIVLLTTTHLITGALMLATSLILTLRASRSSNSIESTALSALTEQYSL
jgi:cytochrome c oxidase assembly protein subunit 15